MTEPLMRQLAKGGQILTVAALPWVAPVYRCMDSVAEVIELPFNHGGLQWAARRAWGQRLKGRFESAYVLPNSFKSALIPFFAAIPHRIGYHGEARWGLLNHRLPNPSKANRPPMVAFYRALAEVGNPSSTDNATPMLRVDPAVVGGSQSLYQLGQQGYCVFAPGAEFGPAKRWPAKHFAALAAQLSLPVVLLGSGKEAPLCQSIVDEAVQLGTKLPAHNLAGKTSLEQALALIAGAAVVISNDSGLMHVAASLGVAQVAVFGSSSPLHTPPLNPNARVLWLKARDHYQPPLSCAPCFKRECPLGHTRCLNDIQPGEVLQHIRELIPMPHTRL